MNFEMLRKELLNAAPNKVDLEVLGISTDEANEIISSFRVEARDEIAGLGLPSDAVVTFFSNYDPSKLEIGMVRFMNFPNSIGSNYVIGQVESDPLIVDKTTGEVYVEDLTSPGRKLWICSNSFEHFLSALIPAAQYLGKCISDNSIMNDKILLNETISACARKSGDDKSIAFFNMLLGAE